MKTTLFTIIFFLLPYLVLACSCFGPNTFCETINAEWNSDLTIISGKKISENDFTMEIEVLRVYRGEESRSRITVLGDRGADCLVYTSRFEVGEELVLALRKGSGWGAAGDDNYALSICGVHFIRCTETIEEMPSCLSEPICSCSKPRPAIYPVPSTGMIYTSIDQEDEILDENINIFNLSGEIIRRLKIGDEHFMDEKLVINMSDLDEGVYFIQYNIVGDCVETKSEKVIILRS